jgi:hypothetical protein
VSKRGKIVVWSSAGTVLRAKSMVGKNVTYHLKYPNGGTDPEVSTPSDPSTGYCDCIGFAAWAAGFDRYQPGKFPLYDGYINTDSMVMEATLPKLKQKYGKIVDGQKWFTVLDRPEDGCFIVAPSFRRRLPPFNRVIGHIGVVVDSSEWETKGLAGLQVVHCSSKNHKAKGNVNKSAVWKTDGTLWGRYRKLYFVRFNREYALGLK